MRARLLAIYLNDHLAGSTLGSELAQRAARENAGSELGTFLGEVLLPEILEDRRTLQRLMQRLGVKQSRAKVAAAWTLEKVGRLKPNGEVIRYSPLSRLLELEGLAAGVEAKRTLWLSLGSALGAVEGFDFDALAERAAAQRSQLEVHLGQAAPRAIGRAR